MVVPQIEPTHIDAWEMRRRFNCGGYQKRASRGEFTSKTYKSRAAPASAGQPPNTQSQMIEYTDLNNNLVAKAHQYLRPDHTVGGSGFPDPKVLFENGVLFHCFRPADRPTTIRRIWASINAIWATLCRWIGR